MTNKDFCFSGLKTGKSIEEVSDELAKRKGVCKIKDITNMSLVIPSVDVKLSKEYIFTNRLPKKSEEQSQYITDISIGKAVRASSSFPAIFCPCDFKEHKFLDGGILDNIPVSEVKKQGADKVIAINFKADDVEQNSNAMDIVMRTLDIMGNKISEESLEKSDFILTIPTDQTGLFDVEKIDKCYEFGYRTTIENLEEIKKILNSHQNNSFLF